MGFLQDFRQRISGQKYMPEILPTWFIAKAMSEQDIETLAKMCILCEPDIRKSYNRYVYYIPATEEGFAKAKKIFSENGINMYQYNSRIMGDRKTEVLRISYKWCSNPNVLYDNADRIRKKCLERFTVSTKIKK
jgi:hypothetical protein